MYRRKRSWYSGFGCKGKRYVKSHDPVSEGPARDLDAELKSGAHDRRYKPERGVRLCGIGE